MSFEQIENLNGQVAVVTGAAGGVGYTTVQRLVAGGAKVVAIVRRDVDVMQAKLNALGEGHIAVLGDVMKRDQIESIAASLSHCDILVNCAGASKAIPHKMLDKLSDEFFDEMLSTNLRSVFTVIRSFAPLLANSPHGLIINIGSASAVRTGGSNIAYAAAKAGLESITRNLALALAPTRVITISPSALDTGFVDLPAEAYGKIAASTPLKRCGTTNDIANAVYACATTMRFMTGNTIVVDGGRTL